MDNIFSKPLHFNSQLPFRDEYKNSNLDKYSRLEIASKGNNYEEVLKLLEKGEILYFSKSSPLCRNKKHHLVCNRKCDTTALYFSLINFCRGYKTIYKTITSLKQIMPQYDVHCDCCNYQNIDDTLYEIVSKLSIFFDSLECVCFVIDNRNKIYREDFLNFRKVHKFFEKIYGKHREFFDNFDKNKNIFINSEKECLKLHRKKQKIFCKCDENCSVGEYDKGIVNELKNIFNWTMNSSNISILLFNQQYYEITKYFITNENNSYSVLNKFLRDSELIDINFREYHKQYFMSDVIGKYCDNVEIFHMFIENGLDVVNKSSMDVMKLAIANGNYKIIENISSKFDTFDDNLLLEIIKSPGLRIDKKINILSFAIDKGSEFEQIHYEEISKMNNNSDVELLKIIPNGKFTTNRDILMNIINNNNISFLNYVQNKYPVECDDFCPYGYILDNFSIKKLKLVKPLSKLCKNVADETLFRGIRENNVEFVEKILKCGFNYLVTFGGETLLTLAIKYKYYDMVDILLDLCDRDLINFPNSIDYPIFLSISDEEIFYSVIKSGKVDLSIESTKNKTLLQTIIEQDIFSVQFMIKIIEILEKHVDINRITSNCKTPPIVFSVMNDNYIVAKYLLDLSIKRNIVSIFYDKSKIINIYDIRHVQIGNIEIRTTDKINYFGIVLKYLFENYREEYEDYEEAHIKDCDIFDGKSFEFSKIIILFLLMFVIKHIVANRKIKINEEEKISQNAQKCEIICNSSNPDNNIDNLSIKNQSSIKTNLGDKKNKMKIGDIVANEKYIRTNGVGKIDKTDGFEEIFISDIDNIDNIDNIDDIYIESCKDNSSEPSNNSMIAFENDTSYDNFEISFIQSISEKTHHDVTDFF